MFSQDFPMLRRSREIDSHVEPQQLPGVQPWLEGFDPQHVDPGEGAEG